MAKQWSKYNIKYQLCLHLIGIIVHTCALVCAFVTNSRPTLIRGRRNAFVNSTTGTPIKWQAFWATITIYTFNSAKNQRHKKEFQIKTYISE